MSRQTDKTGESSRRGSTLSPSDRNGPDSRRSPRRRASWLTITEAVPAQPEQTRPAQSSGLQNWNQFRGGLGSVINQQSSQIVSMRSVTNPTPSSTSRVGFPSSQPGGMSTQSGATGPVSQNFPVPVFPSVSLYIIPSTPAPSPAGVSAGNVLTRQSSSFDMTLNELPRDPQVQRRLQLQRVEMNPNICNDIVSVLNQQSAAPGRNSGPAVAAIPAGPARMAGNARLAAPTGPARPRGPRGPNGPANRAVSAGPVASSYSHGPYSLTMSVGNAGPRAGHTFQRAAIPSGPAAASPSGTAASRKGKAPVVSVDINNLEGSNNHGPNASRWPRGTRLPQGPRNPTIPPPPPASASASAVAVAAFTSAASTASGSIDRPSDSRGPYGRAFYPGFRAVHSSDSVPASTASQTVTVPATVNQGNAVQTTTVSTGTVATGFVPMLAVTRPDMTGRDVTPMPLASQAVVDLNFSPRYHGMHTENNASVENLPADQNCALWITQLPPDVKVTELLAKIRNIGRVFALFINPPDGVAHPKAAAKLVFFRPEGAQKLLRQVRVQPIVIRRHRAQITPNRIKYPTHFTDKGESRVLIITGNKVFVNRASLTSYFEGRFAFQLDDIHTLIEYKDRAVIEYKFGSFRCQAQMGMKALLLDRPRGLEMVEFGADPCEVGSDSTSFTIASERIQGRGLCLPVVTVIQ